MTRRNAANWNWVSAALVATVFVVWVVLPGCAPPPAKKEPPKKPPVTKQEEPVAKPEEKKIEESAKTEGMKEDKKEEPAKIEEKKEEKKEEPAKAEEKKEEKKDEPAKTEEKKEEKKEEPAKTEGKGPAAPAAPKVSKFAPAEDLANQLNAFIDSVGKNLENEADYKDSADAVARDANTLAVIALALGLSDEDNKFKAAAPAIIKAAQGLAATKDFKAATEGLAAVKKAAAGDAKGEGELKWTKVAALDQLMKQVPLVNTKLKRNVKGDRFKSKAKDSAGQSAVLAVIAQGALADTKEAKNDQQIEQWYKFSVQMRDAAGAVNAGIRAGDEKATTEAMEKLAKSCDDCHEVFHKAALEKKE